MWSAAREQGGHGQSFSSEVEVSPAGVVRPAVAVAIDKDKSSQGALKWALDNLVTRGQTIVLVHVAGRSPSSTASSASAPGGREDQIAKEIFLPYRCFCSRKSVRCRDILLDGSDVARAIIEFAAQAAVETIVVGYPAKSSFLRRFKTTDVPTGVSKGAPDFCTVYVINRGKVSSLRQALRQAPPASSFWQHINNQKSPRGEISDTSELDQRAETSYPSRRPFDDDEPIKSPLVRGPRGLNTKPYRDAALMPDTDISFVSSGRSSVEQISPSFYDHLDIHPPSRFSNASDIIDYRSFEMVPAHLRESMDGSTYGNGFAMSTESSGFSCSSQGNMDDVEAEMRRLKIELMQTMDMYNTACKEALGAKQMARELHRLKIEEEQRVEEARLAGEAALVMALKEKEKCRAAVEAAEAAKMIAELEAKRRVDAEMKAEEEALEKKRALDALAYSDLRYRRYTMQEIEVATDHFDEKHKIGEGGYGSVFKSYMDHTHVAIKVLKPDAAQGRSQFQQEVEVLSCIRHPNMVLLLGACPEYGSLVYEYMEKGSLEDCLFGRGDKQALTWQLRFRIAADVATGLLFLHQNKPEPIVHRDLKPGNILLDRNYVSKISDVGLARLVPQSLLDGATQYCMTSTAGTFCYIDPEYQQTGMLGVKSDIYSLGIVLLQLITGGPPMGLAHHVERAIEKGTFEAMLDPAAHDWPVDEALSFAKVALRCAELRRKDRPNLGTEVLPELNRLRALADEHIHHGAMCFAALPDDRSQTSITHDMMSNGPMHYSSYTSSRSCSSFAPSLPKDIMSTTLES